MMSMLMGLIGLIPGLTGLTQFIVGKVYDAKVAITTARIGGDRDVAVAMIKGAAQQDHESGVRLGIIASNPLLVALLLGFAAPLLIYEWKVIVWDVVFELGSTDPIRGQVADWGNTIIYFLFGSPTAVAVAKMYFGRRGSKDG